jgi:hypothetical protein
MVHGALVGSEDSLPVREETRRRRGQLRDDLTQRFERAIADEDLATDADPAALSAYVVAVLRGIAVEAASGAKKNDLRRIAEIAMRAWPT